MKKIKPLEFACFIPFCIIGILIGINTQRTFNIAEEDAYISIILMYNKSYIVCFYKFFYIISIHFNIHFLIKNSKKSNSF